MCKEMQFLFGCVRRALLLIFASYILFSSAFHSRLTFWKVQQNLGNLSCVVVLFKGRMDACFLFWFHLRMVL